MPGQHPDDADPLRTAYAAFDTRHVDAALAAMAVGVTWPKALKGGFAHGHEGVRANWAERWREIDPRAEPAPFRPDAGGRVLVRVHQVVRDLSGIVVFDGLGGRRFTIESGLIRAMEVVPLPPTGQGGWRTHFPLA